MPADARSEWSLVELAAESGIPPRTIRFYIARGLLEGPVHAGRGAVYDSRHMDRLRRIRELQNRGLTLAEIGVALGTAEQPQASAQPESWWQYRIGDDVVISLRAGMSPWRVKQIRGLLERFVREMGDREGNSEDGA